MKSDLKKKAIELRKQGLSYKDILKVVAVSSGTISLWLRDVELTATQKERLSNRSRSQGLGKNGNQKKWEKKREMLKSEYKPPFDNPKFMLGLGLYLGEGAKYNNSLTSVANCDWVLLKIFTEWLKEFFFEDFERFSVYIHHYFPEKDKEIRIYWSNALEIPLADFTKSGFHISKSSQHKKGHVLLQGTAQVRARGKGVWKIRQKIQKEIDELSRKNR
jgi:hypothetical protein